MDFVVSDIDAAHTQAMRQLGTRLNTRDIMARDSAGTFCRQGWKELAAAGLTGLPIPQRYGGQHASALSTVTALAALGQTCTDNGLLFALGAHLWACADPIARFGTQAHKQQWLPGLCDGSLVGAHAATEPDAGSDAAGIRTTATRTPQGWVLNGEKTFVTNAPVADVFVVTARTHPERGSLGLSMFLLPRHTPGLTVGPPIATSGLRTAPMASVTFEDCHLDHDALMGAEGAGMALFSATMTHERTFITAPLVGALHRLAEQCATYTTQRHQFGVPIGDFQSVSNRVAQMRLRAETAALLTQKVAWLTDQRRARAHHAAMVKLHVSEAFLASALDAVQIHGGYGYATDTQLERMVRDAMGARLYSGTSDIQHTLIARARVQQPAKGAHQP